MCPMGCDRNRLPVCRSPHRLKQCSQKRVPFLQGWVCSGLVNRGMQKEFHLNNPQFLGRALTSAGVTDVFPTGREPEASANEAHTQESRKKE
jgi:hypothetical protein